MGWFRDLCLGYLIGAELDNGNMEAAKEYMDELTNRGSKEDDNEDEKK